VIRGLFDRGAAAELLHCHDDKGNDQGQKSISKDTKCGALELAQLVLLCHELLLHNAPPNVRELESQKAKQHL